MDPKLLTGTMEMMILDLLARGDSYGYQLAQTGQEVQVRYPSRVAVGIAGDAIHEDSCLIDNRHYGENGIVRWQ